MKRFTKLPLLVLALLALTTRPALAADELPTYDIDKSHTRLMFFINHAGFSEMVGEFHEYKGFFRFDKERPEQSFAQVKIDPKSVDTGHDGLNGILQGENFFNSKVHSEIVFESTEIKKTSEKEGVLKGNLTMLGVTKPIELEVIFNKEGKFFGQTRAGFTAEGALKRSDFGMNYLLSDVGDEVSIMVQAEGVKREVGLPERRR